MEKLDLCLQRKAGSGLQELLCTMRNIRDHKAVPLWKSFLKSVVFKCIDERSMWAVVQTREEEDWFSDYCAERGVSVVTEGLPKGNVKLTMRPPTRQTATELAEVTMEDSLWTFEGVVSIFLGAPWGESDAGQTVYSTEIRPIDDGQGIICKAPSESIDAIIGVITQLAASSELVVLTWK